MGATVVQEVQACNGLQCPAFGTLGFVVFFHGVFGEGGFIVRRNQNAAQSTFSSRASENKQGARNKEQARFRSCLIPNHDRTSGVELGEIHTGIACVDFWHDVHR